MTNTIHIYDAELLGMSTGVVVKWDGQTIGSWPMGTDEAAERVKEEYPNARIVIHETED